MPLQTVQALVAATLTALIGLITWWLCRGDAVKGGRGDRDFFLAGGGLKRFYVARSITITNLPTKRRRRLRESEKLRRPTGTRGCSR